MNMTEIIDTLGGILIVGIPIVLFILLIKLLPSKGAIGEKRVAHILKKLPEERYKVINNLLLQNNGYTTQIDHIVISVYGIFVIKQKPTRDGYMVGRTVITGRKTSTETSTSLETPYIKTTVTSRPLRTFYMNTLDSPTYPLWHFQDRQVWEYHQTHL